jgi:deazaflavin-dependent oxidoreductase (nitroreductase family)
VRLPDSWSFRQRPSGIFKHVLRLPVTLFRWRLGFLFGDRLILITHRGRRTGRALQTVVEVVEHDGVSGEYVVCSGTGPEADWYRNLRSASAIAVQVGNRTWIPVQSFLDGDEAAARFARYEQAHPRTARRLLESMGNAYDGTDAGRVAMMARMPMVAFSDSRTSACTDRLGGR